MNKQPRKRIRPINPNAQERPEFYAFIGEIACCWYQEPVYDAKYSFHKQIPYEGGVALEWTLDQEKIQHTKPIAKQMERTAEKYGLDWKTHRRTTVDGDKIHGKDVIFTVYWDGWYPKTDYRLGPKGNQTLYDLIQFTTIEFAQEKQVERRWGWGRGKKLAAVQTLERVEPIIHKIPTTREMWFILDDLKVKLPDERNPFLCWDISLNQAVGTGVNAALDWAQERNIPCGFGYLWNDPEKAGAIGFRKAKVSPKEEFVTDSTETNALANRYDTLAEVEYAVGQDASTLPKFHPAVWFVIPEETTDEPN